MVSGQKSEDVRDSQAARDEERLGAEKKLRPLTDPKSNFCRLTGRQERSPPETPTKGFAVRITAETVSEGRQMCRERRFGRGGPGRRRAYHRRDSTNAARFGGLRLPCRGVRLPLIPCFSSFALRNLGVAIDLAKSYRPAADYSINRNESMGTYRSNIMTPYQARSTAAHNVPPVADIINGYYNA